MTFHLRRQLAEGTWKASRPRQEHPGPEVGSGCAACQPASGREASSARPGCRSGRCWGLEVAAGGRGRDPASAVLVQNAGLSVGDKVAEKRQLGPPEEAGDRLQAVALGQVVPSLETPRGRGAVHAPAPANLWQVSYTPETQKPPKPSRGQRVGKPGGSPRPHTGPAQKRPGQPDS